MICAVCYGVLRGHQGSQWRGTFDLHFDHQKNRAELEKSAAISCCMCRSIANELIAINKNDDSLLTKTGNEDYDSVESDGGDRASRTNFTGAYLSELHELARFQQPKLYRLDFKLEDTARVGTFLLEQVGKYISIPFSELY